MDASGARSGGATSSARPTSPELVMAAIAARAVSGAMWTYASYASGRVLVFAGLAIVARLLRPEDVGLFGMAAVSIYLVGGGYVFGVRRGLSFFGGAGRAPRPRSI